MRGDPVAKHIVKLNLPKNTITLTLSFVKWRVLLGHNVAHLVIRMKKSLIQMPPS